jgi:hypothetical protein
MRPVIHCKRQLVGFEAYNGRTEHMAVRQGSTPPDLQSIGHDPDTLILIPEVFICVRTRVALCLILGGLPFLYDFPKIADQSLGDSLTDRSDSADECDMLRGNRM